MANMIFQHTWEQVVAGKKTQTRRIVRKGDYPYPDTGRILEARFNGRPFYACAQTFAVMPARAVKGLRKVADIQITRIRREDVREISEADALAEGFKTYFTSDGYFEFIRTWASMHDPVFKFWYDQRITDYMWYTSNRQMQQGQSMVGGWDELKTAIKSRPLARYDAWALDFRVVNVYEGAVAKARELLREAA